MKTKIPFQRTLSNLSASGRSKNRRSRETQDDDSATTFATESPYKYGEPIKQNRINARRDSKRGAVDTRDAAPALRRASSFQGLKQKFEKISLSAIQRQRDLSGEFRCETGDDIPETFVDEDLTRVALDAPAVEFSKPKKTRSTQSSMQTRKMSNTRSSMTSDQQDDLLASVLGSSAGCVFTEGELQSRMLMKTVASNFDSMSRSVKNLQQGVNCNSSDRLTEPEESKGFLSTLSKEMSSAASRIPKDHDEFVIFLGEELESATCGRPQLPQDAGVYTYDFDESSSSKNSTRRLVAIKEGGAVEEMLESLETGYEASLVGCGAGIPHMK